MMSSASRSEGEKDEGFALIYGLVDPRTSEVRYVGVTVRSLKIRLRDHLRDLKRNDHRTRWIKSLLASGIRPGIKELEVVPVRYRREAEQRWIAFYRQQGSRLVNSTRGGAGTLGYKRSEEERRKIGERSRMRFQDPENRAAVSKVHKGKVISEAHKAAIGAAATRKWSLYREGAAPLSPESRERLRAAARARPPRAWTEESKAKLAAARTRSDVPDELILRLRDEDGLGWTAIGRQVGMSDQGVRERYLRIRAQVA